MNNRLVKIIEELEEYINNRDWEYVYKYMSNKYPLSMNELTEALLDIGIDPAAEMGMVPEGYLLFSTISEYNIPKNVTKILQGAFQQCTHLTNMTVPEGVVLIGRYAFSRCINLETIRLPASLKAIGLEAFSGCKKLTTIYYNGNYSDWVEIQGHSNVIPLSNTTDSPLKLVCKDKTKENKWEI